MLSLWCLLHFVKELICWLHMLPVFCIRFYSPLLLTISTLAVHRWLTLLKDAEKRWMTLAEASNVISDHLCVCESLSDAQFRDKCDGNCGWKENGCTGLFILKTCQLHYGIKISIFGKCIVDCFLAMYFIHFFSILKKLGFYWSETNNLDVKRQLKSSAELHDII